MGRKARSILLGLLGVVGLILLAGVGVVGYLVHIGQPSPASSLAFRGYVPLRSDSMLTVLDYLTVNGDWLYVASESTGDVYKMPLYRSRLPTAREVSTLLGEPAAHGVAFEAMSHLGFVTRSEVNTVDAFDPVNMATIKRIPVADDPDSIIYDVFDRLMYVSSGGSHVASLIDASTLTAVGTIQLGGRPEYAVLDPMTRLLYQNLRDINAVIAVDIAKRAVVQRWPLLGCEAPSGMALDQESHRLFIGCSANSSLAVFDLDEHRVVTVLSIGKGPDSIAFDPQLKRIYSVGRAGVLVVVQQMGANKYSVLDSVHLHYGAHTLTVDSSTHAVYVACAGLIVSPQVAVFMPR